MACVIFHEKCASFSLAMESVILQKAQSNSSKWLVHGCVRTADTSFDVKLWLKEQNRHDWNTVCLPSLV